jgi:hypothetical protein
MAMDRNKFKSLVQYICWKNTSEPSRLGATKLNKILWLADFTAYYRHGNPITGESYVRRQFGPVPRSICPIIAELERERRLIITATKDHGFTKFEYQASEPDMRAFTPDQISIVNWTIDFVCSQTAKSISDLSHDDIWKAAADGEEIPYYTIFATPGEITRDEREWANSEIQSFA